MKKESANMTTAQNGKMRGGARRNNNLPYARKEFKCYCCGKVGHNRFECRYNPDNKDGICYKGTPPPWVLEWQKGPEGAKVNNPAKAKVTKSVESTIESEKKDKGDESN